MLFNAKDTTQELKRSIMKGGAKYRSTVISEHWCKSSDMMRKSLKGVHRNKISLVTLVPPRHSASGYEVPAAASLKQHWVQPGPERIYVQSDSGCNATTAQLLSHRKLKIGKMCSIITPTLLCPRTQS